MYLVSPCESAAHPPRPEHLTWLDALGVLIFAVGLAFEAVGDLQMERYKQDPDNAGKVMDQGHWVYTLHPDYFESACPGEGFSASHWPRPTGGRPGSVGAVREPPLRTHATMIIG
jgi:steroid 5-alpha reductase family enzyme